MPEGGINVNDGYDELEFIDFVNTAQDFGYTKEDTVEQFVISFNLGEEEAKAKVDEYWDPEKTDNKGSLVWTLEVKTFVTTAQRFDHTKEEIIGKLAKTFKLSETEAKELVKKYWVPEMTVGAENGDRFREVICYVTAIRELGFTKEDIAEMLVKRFDLNDEAAREMVDDCWKQEADESLEEIILKKGHVQGAYTSMCC